MTITKLTYDYISCILCFNLTSIYKKFPHFLEILPVVYNTYAH